MQRRHDNRRACPTERQGGSMSMKRRAFLQGTGAAIGLTIAGVPAFAQARTKVKIGYLHTLAVDGQIWTGINRGSFAKEGVDLDMVQFTTGLELFQAMIGGSIDMLATGAVISNFPARGQGQAFLTTDVEIVNQRMSEAVASFISGAVPAVALWVPFNIVVRDKVPQAKMLVDASAYYPQAAIVGGWATRADYYEKNYDVIPRIIRGWVDANDYFVKNPDATLEMLQKNYYQQVPLSDLKEQYKAQKMFVSSEWRRMYADGTVTKWLQQVTDFFVRFGGIQNPTPASSYFETKAYLETVKA